MKLLLTSAGIRNASIQTALVELLGKPIAECDALCIPTAGYGHPFAGPGPAWSFISGRDECPMTELGVIRVCALLPLGSRPPGATADALLQFRVSSRGYLFWPDAVSPAVMLEVRQAAART